MKKWSGPPFRCNDLHETYHIRVKDNFNSIIISNTSHIGRGRYFGLDPLKKRFILIDLWAIFHLRRCQVMDLGWPSELGDFVG